MKLTTEQIAVIRAQIDQSKITIDSLKDDVLDHLCCVVEILMDRGKKFEEATQEALEDLAPDGLDEIQQETMFLLNSTKIIFMKKVTYGIGLLASMSFVLGWAFGILHYPGSRELSIGGFLAFVFFFIPLLVMDRFKHKMRWTFLEKTRFIVGGVSGIFITVALGFKIMHLPGADELLLIGSLLFVFGFLPSQFFTLYKKSIS